MFNKFLYEPLSYILVFLSNQLGDLGLAIIVLTILIRLILLPLFYKGAKDQAILQRLAPKIKEIQTAHKNDREKQTKALLALYKEHKVNPLSGFLLLFIQLPILFALYRVFIFLPGFLNPIFLGIINLKQKNNVIIFLAALAQYFQGKLSVPKNNKSFKELTPAEQIGRQMIYLGPLLTIGVLYFLPSAAGLYWLTTSLFSVIQQLIINARIKI